MSNKYKGTCYRCGKLVEPGAGVFERQYSRFRLQHHECVKLYKGKVSPYQIEQAEAGNIEAKLDVGKFKQKVEQAKVMYPIELAEWVRANWGSILKRAAYGSAKAKGQHAFSHGDSLNQSRDAAAYYLTHSVSTAFLLKNMPKNPYIEPEEAKEFILAALFKEFRITAGDMEFS